MLPQFSVWQTNKSTHNFTCCTKFTVKMCLVDTMQNHKAKVEERKKKDTYTIKPKGKRNEITQKGALYMLHHWIFFYYYANWLECKTVEKLRSVLCAGAILRGKEKQAKQSHLKWKWSNIYFKTKTETTTKTQQTKFESLK